MSLLPVSVLHIGSLVDDLQPRLKDGILSDMSMVQWMPAAVVLVLMGANEIAFSA